MSYKDPHNHHREPVSPAEAQQAAEKGLIWDASVVAFREPETALEAAQVEAGTSTSEAGGRPSHRKGVAARDSN